QQYSLLAGDRISRVDSWTSPAGIYGCAVPTVSPAFQHALLGRRRSALLGDVVVGHELRQVAREPNRHALLANAPLGSDHLLVELSSGKDDAAGMHRSAGEESRTRAGQRDCRSSSLVWRSVRTAVSMRLPARRPAASVVASRARRFRQDDQPVVSRRRSETEPDFDRDDPRGFDEAEVDS